MSKQEATKAEASDVPAGLPKHAPTGFGAVAGEIAGVVVGSVAGPAGAVAGMILGAIAGEVAGDVLDWESDRSRRHEEELDATIGTIGGLVPMRQNGGPELPLPGPS
jgi:hypothetical protein